MTNLRHARLLLPALLLVADAIPVLGQTTYTETVLHSFAPVLMPMGSDPWAGVIRDEQGNLYGTTTIGGAWGAGAVYKVDTSGRATVLYSFTGAADGGNPYAGLIRDAAGNLFGTTLYGGNLSSCPNYDPGCGVIFKIEPSGHETVLYAFTGGSDGAGPYAGLVRDSAGNLYGTTYGGGASGKGVVFKLDTAGNLTVLHYFTGGVDGGYPYGGVVLDSGYLYGTTVFGGAANDGVVYKLDNAGHETVLYTFTRGADGGWPYAGVTLDPAGNIYGTTELGGAADAGVVFKLDNTGHETVLHSFTGGAGGSEPVAGVILDPAGNIYGTTWYGGSASGYGYGVIFKLDPTGQESVLYTFQRGADGAAPRAGVIRDSAGNLYGTTTTGGGYTSCPDGYGHYSAGCGVVFKLDPTGQETVLYNLYSRADGILPMGSLFRDSAGNFYGTTSGNPVTYGTLYKIDASGHEMVLHSFTGTDGCNPYAGVTGDATGNLYGTTNGCGAYRYGTVYKMDPSGNFTVLHAFGGGTRGRSPNGGVTIDPAGNLYGTTALGGPNNAGVVYKLDTAGNYSVLFNFGVSGWSQPEGTLAIDSASNLYGTTTQGGVFKLDPAGHFTELHNFTSAAVWISNPVLCSTRQATSMGLLTRAAARPLAIHPISWVAAWCSNSIRPAMRQSYTPSLAGPMEDVLLAGLCWTRRVTSMAPLSAAARLSVAKDAASCLSWILAAMRPSSTPSWGLAMGPTPQPV